MGWMALVDTTTGKEVGVVGDEPWDIMGEALDKCAEVIEDAVIKVNKAYREQWHRDVTEIEIDAVIKFTQGGIMQALRKDTDNV